MKKIADYRKLLSVDKNAELKDLKSVYRTLMKDFHPDKFQEEEDRLNAEAKSKEIIEAYHFLVSIASETRDKNLETYTQTTTLSNIQDFEYKQQVLIIHFYDGSSYEYFDVPRAVYIKLVNADSPGRFARRHIFNEYPYRNVAKVAETA
ncbi:KTSC domain-containing protein [Pedobacter xixiisoli]|uniref:DnaJ domain-containing protein n=1 Tax=Pedobacter xixiisoli TaxID=1476464 RepID=A0A286A824_9SPHI|nr:KTSC domain-containing protein [Pedobacter xixiisoli]SOD18068.1 DnaJ domain-containing protein [Pedobacter xixiisoli]